MIRKANRGVESLADIRVSLAGRLRARQPEIVEAILARIRDVIPDSSGYEDAEYETGFRPAVEAVVDYGLTAIEHEGEWTASIPWAAVVQAHRAARGGVSLDTVLLRYTVGHSLFWEFILHEAEQGDFVTHRMVLLHTWRTQASLLVHLVSSISDEYKQEVARIAQSPEQCRADRVRRLLAGAPISANEFDYPLDAWHVGVIAMGADAKRVVRALASNLDRQILAVPGGDSAIWAWFGGLRKPMFKDIQSSLKAIPDEVSLAVGEPARGLDGWRRTHRQAQAAHLVALRSRQQLTRFADVLLDALVLRNEEFARSLIELFLSPLDGLQDDGQDLRTTLRAYFAKEHNASSAGAAMGTNRRTVKRRVLTIEEALGCPLHKCQPELALALRLEALLDCGE